MKTCFKCLLSKPLDEFYSHPRMADGHLNKCKACSRSDTAKRKTENKKNPDWIEKEILRSRLKSRRERAEGKYRGNRTDETDRSRRFREKNPLKYKAHNLVNNAIRSGKITPLPCVICGEKAQAHHEDYSKPLDVIWYCPQHHSERHVEIRRLERLARRKSL